MNDNLKKAQAAAHSPEARAKRQATMKATLKRKREEKMAANRNVTPDAVREALGTIPLDAIPDRAPRKYAKKAGRGNTPVVDSRLELAKSVVEVVNRILSLTQEK